MTHFESFDSFEEMLDAIGQRRDEANTTLSPEQEALGWGCHFVNFEMQIQETLFGYVFTQQEVYDADTKLGASTEEALSTLQRITEMQQDGYLFGKVWSVIEPDGELGDTHKANCWPLSPGLFQKAKAADWSVSYLAPADLLALNQVYQDRRAHALRVAGGWRRS